MEKVSDIDALMNWLREPDYAETLSLVEMATWINARPIAAVIALTAERDALKHDIERLKGVLEQLLFWNEGILAGRGNYHPRDHINKCKEGRAALSPTQADGRGAAVVSKEQTNG